MTTGLRGTRIILVLLTLACLAPISGAAAQEPTRSLSLTVHGAAQQVGGSCFLLDADGQKMRVTFHPTEQIPGSAMTVVRTQTRNGAYRVAWSGDHGGGDHPLRVAAGQGGPTPSAAPRRRESKTPPAPMANRCNPHGRYLSDALSRCVDTHEECMHPSPRLTLRRQCGNVSASRSVRRASLHERCHAIVLVGFFASPLPGDAGVTRSFEPIECRGYCHVCRQYTGFRGNTPACDIGSTPALAFVLRIWLQVDEARDGCPRRHDMLGVRLSQGGTEQTLGVQVYAQLGLA